VTVGISLQYLVQEHYNTGSAVTAGGDKRLICSVVLTQITSVTKNKQNYFIAAYTVQWSSNLWLP